MWQDLAYPWKEAFRLAWESYRHNTVPIGAVIVDHYENVIAEGRNLIFDKESSNPLAGTYMAHAEMTAMIQLKEKDHPNIREYSLYTTMEPCPMCFGTMLMMHIYNLKYAARDGFAGATALKDTLEYIQKKPIKIEKGTHDLELFQIVLQSSFEYKRNHCVFDTLLNKWREYCSEGVNLGQELWKEHYFENAIDSRMIISEIYDDVMRRYRRM